jgi:hypothetical protein
MKTTAILTALALTGCGGSTTLQLDTTDLPDTGPGMYALWLSAADGDPELMGTFRDNDGSEITVDDLGAYDEALVTIETGDPTTPGAAVLRGPVSATGADLSFAIEVDISGGVSLWTPTDAGVNDDNHHQGAWFMERVADAGQPALELAPPADGWSFSGWTATQGFYLPMGTFSARDEPDSNCFFCGADDVVGVPGEDFIAAIPPELPGAVDLADGDSSVVISLSPDIYDLSPDVYDLSPDVYDLDGDEPFRFAFDVLSVDVPLDQGGGELMDLADVLVAPSGGLTIPE